jgi:NitT/TauT family transport system substrate-binding protein
MKRLMSLAAAVTAAMALAACGGGSGSGAAAGSGMTPIPLRIATTAPTAALLPWYVGVEKGFFAEQGFDTSYVTVSSGSAMMPALSANQVDVVSSALVTELLIDQGGQDLKVVSGWTRGYNYTVYARNDVNLPAAGTFEQKMAALAGKKIGVQGGSEGVTAPFLKAMISLGGADPATVSLPNVAFGGPQIAALQSGEIDAVLTDDSTMATADQLGLGSRYFSLLNDAPADYKDLLISGAAVRASSLTEHADFASRFQAAMDKTVAWIKDPANADDLRSVAVQELGLSDSPGLPQSLVVLAGTLEPGLDRAQAQKSLDFLYSSGQVKPEPKVTPEEFFDPGMIRS